ncbi:aromatic ring-hydroxylating dioxygenase subunit alpha [Variovorax sp. J22P168]|uniref:aromatic ring-hydroxylating dioxygenase subunit alpha n=1 Tax=Variovorax jilinensis TaxID=3053513 RepID=UPI002575229A|nr:aromatic ring-hydroxylating dioxygenase subunit alpha [Variovorax sp. J22P168]MDM0012080.1 aromatic ring-hydroxylating dioxygenase subunit alpha [Variovorax sp. J22P168]
MNMFLKNCWYVAAWDHEILGDTLLSRTLLGQPVLFYRKEDGTVVAMDNKCCHRHAPLHMGRKEGDCVRCMYHGAKYDATGACVEVPGQDRIPPKLRQRVYPTAQRKRWVWIWMGDPALADDTLIPDTFSLAHPDWRWKPSYLHYECNYLLISDNLLDFSHLSYVHEKTFGGSPNIAEARPEVQRISRGVRVSRPVRGTVPAPYHQRLGSFEGKVDRWFRYDFHVPGILLLDAGVKSAATPDDDMSGALQFHSCQAITPETEKSTHYFFMQAHNFRLDDAVVTESIDQSQKRAFIEDKQILEAQQQMIDNSPESPMVAMAADAGLMQYRRLLNELIDLENKAPAVIPLIPVTP